MKKTFGLVFWFILLFLALSSCMGDAAIQLEGSYWELASLDGRPVIPGAPPTLYFEDGKVGGMGGCNSFGGEYSVRGGQIKFDSPFASTLMACADNDRMEQETLYMQILGQVEQIELSSGELILTTAQGEQLVFLPAE